MSSQREKRWRRFCGSNDSSGMRLAHTAVNMDEYVDWQSSGSSLRRPGWRPFFAGALDEFDAGGIQEEPFGILRAAVFDLMRGSGRDDEAVPGAQRDRFE